MKKTKSRLMLETIIKEIITENEAQLFEPTKEGIAQFANELKSKIKTPIFQVSNGALGGTKTAYLIVGLDPKSEWKNNIFENSRYFKMSIDFNGVMEVFTASLNQKSTNRYTAFERIPIKFRKATAKSVQDAISKIQKFIDQIETYYAQLDPALKP